MSATIVRRYSRIRDIDKVLKAAKTLGLRIVKMEAVGAWRRLWPEEGTRQGPFAINRGTGPCFTTVVGGLDFHMLDDTSAVEIHFSDEAAS